MSSRHFLGSKERIGRQKPAKAVNSETEISATGNQCLWSLFGIVSTIKGGGWAGVGWGRNAKPSKRNPGGRARSIEKTLLWIFLGS